MSSKKINQQIPTYKENFKKDKRWIQKETKHYVFHYFSDSVAKKEIVAINRRQEKVFNKIVSFLKIKTPKKKIKYYLYPNSKIKKELMGDKCQAQAIYHDFCVHVIYTKKHKPIGEHEDTHLLSLPLGVPVGFFQEGLAEYMSGNRKWNRKPQSFWLKDGIKKNIIPPLETMMTQRAWMNSPDRYAPYYYIFAKSFVGFLIKNFGLKKFIKLYKKTNREKTSKQNKKALENIYGLSIIEMERKWKENVLENIG